MIELSTRTGNRVVDSVTDLIGATPVVRLRRIAREVPATVLVKLEAMNPGRSVKDRSALGMVEAAERDGLIAPGRSVVIEATSGNAGVALAMVCAARRYRCVIAMPETMGLERRRSMRAYGAEVVLTPGDEGMAGAIAETERIAAAIPGAYLPRQFANPANPDAHRRTTAEEIWADTDGRIDVLVAGVGSGGSITGVAGALRARRPGFHAVAVEPAGSAVLSGGPPGPHPIDGIGAGFVPSVLDPEAYDEVIACETRDAVATARRLAREEGILAGLSAGANVWAALRVAARPECAGAMILTLAGDAGDPYLMSGLAP